MQVPLTMMSRGEYLTPPPGGHMGILVYTEKPNCKVGDHLEFVLFDTVIFRGVVVGFERPGRCMRNDVPQKDVTKWKLHWIPYGLEDEVEKLFERIKSKLDCDRLMASIYPSKQRVPSSKKQIQAAVNVLLKSDPSAAATQLKNEVKQRGWTFTRFAEEIGWTTDEVERVIRGDKIGPIKSKQLSKLFGYSNPDFWHLLSAKGKRL